MVVKTLDKKSQITVFIIFAIVIVLIALILFFYRDNFKSLFISKSPVDQLKECTLSSLKGGIEKVSLQGGVINPKNYYLYQGNKIEYVCYTEESYKRCVMQKPFLKDTIEDELEDYLQPSVKDCLIDIKASVKKSGKILSYKTPDISVELFPDIIEVNINLDLDIGKNGKKEIYKNIRTDFNSKLYDFAMIAGEIANTEAKYGDADITGFMFKNKNLKVEKFKQGDETKVYILTDRKSNNQFYFAIKSIPIPPGWIELEKFG